MLGVTGTVSSTTAPLNHMPGLHGNACFNDFKSRCSQCFGDHFAKECVVKPTKNGEGGWRLPREGSCCRCGLSSDHGGNGVDACGAYRHPPVWKVCWALLRVPLPKLSPVITFLENHPADFPVDLVVGKAKQSLETVDIRRYYNWLSSPWSEAHGITCGAVLFTLCYLTLKGVSEREWTADIREALNMQYKTCAEA